MVKLWTYISSSHYLKSSNFGLPTVKSKFSSHSLITLSELYKGKPHEDVLYLNSLLRGGDVGYKWSIREYYKKRKGT